VGRARAGRAEAGDGRWAMMDDGRQVVRR
jgi:hypothetical protein